MMKGFVMSNVTKCPVFAKIVKGINTLQLGPISIHVFSFGLGNKKTINIQHGLHSIMKMKACCQNLVFFPKYFNTCKISQFLLSIHIVLQLFSKVW